MLGRLLAGIRPSHLAALGALLISVSAQVAAWPSWAAGMTPAGLAGVVGSIGATLIALFADKPRDPQALTRFTDPTPKAR